MNRSELTDITTDEWQKRTKERYSSMESMLEDVKRDINSFSDKLKRPQKHSSISSPLSSPNNQLFRKPDSKNCILDQKSSTTQDNNNIDIDVIFQNNTAEKSSKSLNSSPEMLSPQTPCNSNLVNAKGSNDSVEDSGFGSIDALRDPPDFQHLDSNFSLVGQRLFDCGMEQKLSTAIDEGDFFLVDEKLSESLDGEDAFFKSWRSPSDYNNQNPFEKNTFSSLGATNCDEYRQNSNSSSPLSLSPTSSWDGEKQGERLFVEDEGEDVITFPIRPSWGNRLQARCTLSTHFEEAEDYYSDSDSENISNNSDDFNDDSVIICSNLNISTDVSEPSFVNENSKQNINVLIVDNQFEDTAIKSSESINEIQSLQTNPDITVIDTGGELQEYDMYASKNKRAILTGDNEQEIEEGMESDSDSYVTVRSFLSKGGHTGDGSDSISLAESFATCLDYSQDSESDGDPDLTLIDSEKRKNSRTSTSSENDEYTSPLTPHESEDEYSETDTESVLLNHNVNNDFIDDITSETNPIPSHSSNSKSNFVGQLEVPENSDDIETNNTFDVIEDVQLKSMKTRLCGTKCQEHAKNNLFEFPTSLAPLPPVDYDKLVAAWQIASKEDSHVPKSSSSSISGDDEESISIDTELKLKDSTDNNSENKVGKDKLIEINGDETSCSWTDTDSETDDSVSISSDDSSSTHQSPFVSVRMSRKDHHIKQHNTVQKLPEGAVTKVLSKEEREERIFAALTNLEVCGASDVDDSFSSASYEMPSIHEADGDNSVINPPFSEIPIPASILELMENDFRHGDSMLSLHPTSEIPVATVSNRQPKNISFPTESNTLLSLPDVSQITNSPEIVTDVLDKYIASEPSEKLSNVEPVMISSSVPLPFSTTSKGGATCSALASCISLESTSGVPCLSSSCLQTGLSSEAESKTTTLDKQKILHVYCNTDSSSLKHSAKEGAPSVNLPTFSNNVGNVEGRKATMHTTVNKSVNEKAPTQTLLTKQKTFDISKRECLEEKITNKLRKGDQSASQVTSISTNSEIKHSTYTESLSENQTKIATERIDPVLYQLNTSRNNTMDFDDGVSMSTSEVDDSFRNDILKNNNNGFQRTLIPVTSKPVVQQFGKSEQVTAVASTRVFIKRSDQSESSSVQVQAEATGCSLPVAAARATAKAVSIASATALGNANNSVSYPLNASNREISSNNHNQTTDNDDIRVYISTSCRVRPATNNRGALDAPVASMEDLGESVSLSISRQRDALQSNGDSTSLGTLGSSDESNSSQTTVTTIHRVDNSHAESTMQSYSASTSNASPENVNGLLHAAKLADHSGVVATTYELSPSVNKQRFSNNSNQTKITSNSHRMEAALKTQLMATPQISENMTSTLKMLLAEPSYTNRPANIVTDSYKRQNSYTFEKSETLPLSAEPQISPDAYYNSRSAPLYKKHEAGVSSKPRFLRDKFFGSLSSNSKDSTDSPRLSTTLTSRLGKYEETISSSNTFPSSSSRTQTGSSEKRSFSLSRRRRFKSTDIDRVSESSYGLDAYTDPISPTPSSTNDFISLSLHDLSSKNGRLKRAKSNPAGVFLAGKEDYKSNSKLLETDIDTGFNSDRPLVVETDLDSIVNSVESSIKSRSMHNLHMSRNTAGAPTSPIAIFEFDENVFNRAQSMAYLSGSKKSNARQLASANVGPGLFERLRSKAKSASELRIAESVKKLNIPDWLDQGLPADEKEMRTAKVETYNSLQAPKRNSRYDNFSRGSSTLKSSPSQKDNIGISSRVKPPRSATIPSKISGLTSTDSSTPFELPSKHIRAKSGDRSASLRPIDSKLRKVMAQQGGLSKSILKKPGDDLSFKSDTTTTTRSINRKYEEQWIVKKKSDNISPEKEIIAESSSTLPTNMPSSNKSSRLSHQNQVLSQDFVDNQQEQEVREFMAAPPSSVSSDYQARLSSIASDPSVLSEDLAAEGIDLRRYTLSTKPTSRVTSYQKKVYESNEVEILTKQGDNILDQQHYSASAVNTFGHEYEGSPKEKEILIDLFNNRHHQAKSIDKTIYRRLLENVHCFTNDFNYNLTMPNIMSDNSPNLNQDDLLIEMMSVNSFDEINLRDFYIESSQALPNRDPYGQLSIQCNYATCGKMQSLKFFGTTSCYNCFSYYCSKGCRSMDWQEHRGRCTYGRPRRVGSKVLKALSSNQLHAFSEFAQACFPVYGRGCIMIVFSSYDAAQRFITCNTNDQRINQSPDKKDNLLGPPIYLTPIELERLDRTLVTPCLNYNTQNSFVLTVTVGAPAMMDDAGRCRFFKQCVVLPLHLESSLLRSTRATVPALRLSVESSAPSENERNGMDKISREAHFSQVQRFFRDRGVIIRSTYPELFAMLNLYVEKGIEFSPQTIQFVDFTVGKSVTCVVYPNCLPRIEFVQRSNSQTVSHLETDL